MSPGESRLHPSGSVAGLVPIDVATGASLSEARTGTHNNGAQRRSVSGSRDAPNGAYGAPVTGGM